MSGRGRNDLEGRSDLESQTPAGGTDARKTTESHAAARLAIAVKARHAKAGEAEAATKERNANKWGMP